MGRGGRSQPGAAPPTRCTCYFTTHNAHQHTTRVTTSRSGHADASVLAQSLDLQKCYKHQLWVLLSKWRFRGICNLRQPVCQKSLRMTIHEQRTTPSTAGSPGHCAERFRIGTRRTFEALDLSRQGHHGFHEHKTEQHTESSVGLGCRFPPHDAGPERFSSCPLTRYLSL